MPSTTPIWQTSAIAINATDAMIGSHHGDPGLLTMR
jgi:hypothetical protein